MSGARYEISIDGVVRTHRDIRDVAVVDCNVFEIEEIRRVASWCSI